MWVGSEWQGGWKCGWRVSVCWRDSCLFFIDLIEKNAGDGVRSFYNHLGECT